MKKLLVILGPTATGKTDLALQLARKFDGEIVAADSRQVYIGLDIGTGKYPGSEKWEVRRRKGKWEVGGINIWMYDVVDPKSQYSVADYVKDASRVISEIHKKGKLPIIVGGTGLYLRALLDGLPNLAIPIDKKLRKKLENLTKDELQKKLKSLSPSRWESLNNSDRQNPRRLVRAIEMELSPQRNPYGHLRGGKLNYEHFKIGLTASREILDENVDTRVVSRIKQGLIEEAKKLHKESLTLKRMRQLGLEYGVLADYLDGKIKSSDELVVIMQGKIHGFVRRQLTWFKKEKDIHWFDITDRSYIIKVEKLIAKWYDSGT